MKRTITRPFAMASAVLATAALTAALAGCSSSASADGAGKTASGSIQLVASTDVWGSVATAIGGAHVDVTSIIDDPDKDPHEYQADARNQLAISKAQIVVQNGGGYDDFVGTMVKASKKNPVVLTAATISGIDQHPSDGEFNEHLWYDFPTVEKVAAKLAAAFEKTDAAHKADYQANLSAFDAKLDGYEQQEAQLKTQYAGVGAAITEPVPLYMLDAISLVNRTPEKFSEGIENGTDVAPAVLQQTLQIFDARQVKLLAYNEQTTGAQTQAVLDAAKKNGIAVVPVTETLPKGDDYLSWMQANLTAIGDALAG